MLNWNENCKGQVKNYDLGIKGTNLDVNLGQHQNLRNSLDLDLRSLTLI